MLGPFFSSQKQVTSASTGANFGLCQRQNMQTPVVIFGAAALLASFAICSGLEAHPPVLVGDDTRVLNQENVIGPTDPSLFMQCRRGHQADPSIGERCRERQNSDSRN
jgi:hypothetical protein